MSLWDQRQETPNPRNILSRRIHCGIWDGWQTGVRDNVESFRTKLCLHKAQSTEDSGMPYNRPSTVRLSQHLKTVWTRLTGCK